MNPRTWESIAEDAQQRRDMTIASIEPHVPDVPQDLPLNVTSIPGQLLSSTEVEITEKSTEELVHLLVQGKLTSVEVVTAFLRRAGLAQKLANCVTEVLTDRALSRARYLDEYLAQNGRPIGPLHGLPISVKEHIAMKGLTLNAAYVAWYDRVENEDANTLKLLWNAGAVFYVRTTEPQCLMHLETSSNLYGVTVNPYNRHLTSGGSSGGEGALLALRGSCLGIGTDIGGSVRSPGANCGVWSFRPSSYRVPDVGAIAPMTGEEQIVPIMGPMSTSFGGLHLFMKTLLDQKPWLIEPSLLPLPWSFLPSRESSAEPKRSKKLKVGVIWDDRVVRPHPPISRALHSVVDLLKNHPERFDIVDWKPLKHDVAWDIISSLYFPDGGKQCKNIIAQSGEPWRPLSRFIIHEQASVKEYTISEVWELTIRREAYRTEYLQHWNLTGELDGSAVDVILCPVGPGAAPPLDHARYWGYTSQWNLLDYPAMTFPVSYVDEELDKLKDEELQVNALNEQDDWNWKLWTEGGGAKRYKDAPVSLQLVGRRWQDEKVFEAMELIKDAVGLR